MRRGEIYYIDIPEDKNDRHKQCGLRPCIIMSNNKNNMYCSRVQYIPLTTQLGKPKLPTHIPLNNTRLQKFSIALCEGIDAIDKSFVREKIGRVSDEDMISVEIGTLIQLYPENRLKFFINNMAQFTCA